MMSHKYRVRNVKFSTLPERWIVHRLQKDDTLYRLAEVYGTSVLRILRDNPALDPRQLFLGQAVLIYTEKNPPSGGLYSE